MQEEIENRTVTLIISAVKLTARELKAGMDKYLSEKKSKAMEKARAAPEKPSGKQTVRQLIGQNQGVSNIEITNSNMCICSTRLPATGRFWRSSSTSRPTSSRM